MKHAQLIRDLDIPTRTNASINTLMLIEDNTVDQMICKRVIERSGCVRQLLQFHYATDALEYLASKDRPEVDAILLDINMPRMDGFEFLEAATKAYGAKFARVVVIMLTTSLAPWDAARAAKYEVVKDFLNKPLTQAHLGQISDMLQRPCGKHV